MAQVKVYGTKTHLKVVKTALSEVIHLCVTEVLQLPKEKKFHRFFPMDEVNMLYPSDRSHRYIIIEIMMMEGRTVETKKWLIALLFERIRKEIGIPSVDIEIVIQEVPAYQFGFRGMTGDEMLLDYKVVV